MRQQETGAQRQQAAVIAADAPREAASRARARKSVRPTEAVQLQLPGAGGEGKARAEIMSGGPSAVLRPFAGAGRPCAFTTAPPETRGGDLGDGPAGGIDGTAAVELPGRL